jgi:glycerophosphoryl diester phosphodiesterase
MDTWQDNWPELVKTTDAATINMNADILSEERVRQLTESQLPVLAYTVNDPLRAKELLYWGVTAVFSDNPKTIIKAL